MIELSNEERETHLSLVADNRSTWHVYSDDPVMVRRLESVGAKLIRVAADGVGRFYELPSSQITIRKPKKPMSDEHRARLYPIGRKHSADYAVVDSETVRIDSMDNDGSAES
jgi:hypothetical protein